MNNDTFTPTGMGKYMMKGEGFSISYNPAPWSGVSLFESDGGSAETALVIEGYFFILNGDFREEYAALVPKGLKECVKFYLSQDSKSSWSEDEEEARAFLED